MPTYLNGLRTLSPPPSMYPVQDVTYVSGRAMCPVQNVSSSHSYGIAQELERRQCAQPESFRRHALQEAVIQGGQGQDVYIEANRARDDG